MQVLAHFLPNATSRVSLVSNVHDDVRTFDSHCEVSSTPEGWLAGGGPRAAPPSPADPAPHAPTTSKGGQLAATEAPAPPSLALPSPPFTRPPFSRPPNPPPHTHTQGRQGLVFVGNYAHAPNREAVVFLLKKVLPRVRCAGGAGAWRRRVAWGGCQRYAAAGTHDAARLSSLQPPTPHTHTHTQPPTSHTHTHTQPPTPHPAHPHTTRAPQAAGAARAVARVPCAPGGRGGRDPGIPGPHQGVALTTDPTLTPPPPTAAAAGS